MTKISEAQSTTREVLLYAPSHQTPFFLIDLSKVEEAYRQLQTALRDAELFYALKANAEPQIIKRLAKLGAHFEIASVNELHLLLSLGVKAKDVNYSNPVKPWQQIKEAYHLGLRKFAFDSVGELEKLAQYAPGASVYLRFRVSDKGSTFPLSKKFGAETYNIKPLMKMAGELGLKPFGLTFHVGSQSHDPYRWDLAIQAAGEIMTELQAEGIKLTTLNIGGGFPANYGKGKPQLATIGRIVHSALKKYMPYSVQLAAEPGRAMVAEAGTLVTSVIGRTVRGRKHWLYLDVGAFSGMMETLETNNRFRYPITTSRRWTRHTKTTEFILTGPTCDPQDTMFYGVTLPFDLAVNDRLYIHSAGAYTIPYASTFNGFAIPEVFCIDSKKPKRRTA